MSQDAWRFFRGKAAAVMQSNNNFLGKTHFQLIGKGVGKMN